MGGGFVLGEVRGCPESGWSRQGRWANKEKSNVCGTVGREVSRCVRGSGKPASRFWQRGRMSKAGGCPQCAGLR